MRKFIKSIYQFFLTIYIFKSYSKFKKVDKKSLSVFLVNSKNKAKINKIIQKYFIYYKPKLNRFKKKSQFIGVKNSKEILCSGWIYFGSSWKIDEIDKKIKLKNEYLLYDFETNKKFRNMGYYKLLLRVIQNKFVKKKLVIYSLSHNFKSINAIKKSGFHFTKKF